MSSPCWLCDSTNIEPLLERDRVPVLQNVLLESPAEARALPTGDLRIVICSDCGFVFNQAFDSERIHYSAGYENSQYHSPSFQAHQADLLARLARPGLKHFVEVGCGDGFFLKQVVDQDATRTGWGFDPSFKGDPTQIEGRLHFEALPLEQATWPERFDALLCRHVIEHLPRPLGMLGSLANILQTYPPVSLFFETPDIDWILSQQAMWDFFYEHCNYFSAASLSFAFARAGLRPVAAEYVFTGQYLWLEARSGPDAPAPVADPARTLELAKAYRAHESALIAHWRQVLAQKASEGKICLWGAGAKGVTFAHLLDPEQQLIDCIIDINPRKQGKFLPGTGHPILAREALADRGVKTAILMNPNYAGEIRDWLQAHHPEIEAMVL